MKKSGSEKKRESARSKIRRSALQNGSGRDASDVSSKKPATGKDVFQVFAEKVRDNKQLESRWAVLQETRVEYFRGKDIVKFMRKHPELKELLGSENDLEVEDIINILLKKNLLVRCDRVVKAIRPGKKKLSTWPAHLEIFHG